LHIAQISKAAAEPLRRRLGPSLLAMLVAAVVTLAVELALVERKSAIFSGGFGQSRTLDRGAEILAFTIGLAASQLALIAALFWLMKLLHGRRRDTPLFLFNFLFFVPAALILVLIAKFKALSYFSDAVGFQVIRNLGGGSLMDAFLFALSDAGLLALAAGGSLILYLLLFRLYRRRFAGAELPPSRPPRRRHTIFALAALPFMLFGASRVGDAGYALARFNSYYLLATLFGQVSDLDRDGYSLFSRPTDSHPFDSKRHPLALDVPGNGLDEDGYGGDLKLAPVPPPAPDPVFPAAKQHVVLVVLESTRADALGKRVAGRPVTPNISALAASGTAVRHVYSHVGFTTESLISLFTGSLAASDDRQSLFRDFKANGYRVGIFSGQSESFGDIAGVTGMRRHSDVFVDAETLKEERAFSFAAKGSLLVDGQILLREFDRSFGAAAGWQRPNFLYFNFQSAHFPYHSPGMKDLLTSSPIPRGEINAANRDRVALTYWNAVAYSDWLVGQVIARLKRLGVYESSVILVTSDHGESLFEEGFLGHGHMLTPEQTRIPLVISRPGIEVDQPVGLDGVRAILLRAAGATGVGDAPRPVLQYIGTLDRPSVIGLVGPRGELTTLDLESGEVRLNGRAAGAYSSLPRGSPVKAKVDALIRLWGTQRWLHREVRGCPKPLSANADPCPGAKLASLSISSAKRCRTVLETSSRSAAATESWRRAFRRMGSSSQPWTPTNRRSSVRASAESTPALASGRCR
jgi:Sulfatase